MKDAQQDVIEELRRELEKAERDLNMARQPLNDEREALCAALSGATKLTKELTAHKEALEKCEAFFIHRTGHDPLCDSLFPHAELKCDCGYAEALAAIAKCKEGK